MTDWRLPENRRELFQRHYSFQLKHKNLPGMVYSMLPAIAEHFELDDDGRAWLVWLNGNTQNVVTSYLLLEAARNHNQWEWAVRYWNDHFKQLEWDTDRRHQKGKFGEATEKWYHHHEGLSPAEAWRNIGSWGWKKTWAYSKSQPYMGRLSAWSMMEYARILLGESIPDMGSFLLDDVSGSRSHRNGLAVVAGYDAWNWDAEVPFMLDLVPYLEILAESLLEEARERNAIPNKEMGWSDVPSHVTRLTLESCLCTTKSMWKTRRRYPNVYADMMAERIWKAEARMGRKLDVLWDIRKKTLPKELRLEDNPHDPGLDAVKQDWFRLTGEVPVIGLDFPDMWSEFDRKVQRGEFGIRKDKRW